LSPISTSAPLIAVLMSPTILPMKACSLPSSKLAEWDVVMVSSIFV